MNSIQLEKTPEVSYQTTMNLKPGNEILSGNAVVGFDSYTIVSVEESGYNARMAQVTIKFNHGGTATANYGKNTRWAVTAN